MQHHHSEKSATAIAIKLDQHSNFSHAFLLPFFQSTQLALPSIAQVVQHSSKSRHLLHIWPQSLFRKVLAAITHLRISGYLFRGGVLGFRIWAVWEDFAFCILHCLLFRYWSLFFWESESPGSFVILVYHGWVVVCSSKNQSSFCTKFSRWDQSLDHEGAAANNLLITGWNSWKSLKWHLCGTGDDQLRWSADIGCNFSPGRHNERSSPLSVLCQ